MNRLKVRQLSKSMNSHQLQDSIVTYWTQRCNEILHERATLPRDELEYLVEQTSKLKNARLATGIAGLIGWGDEERAELETFCALALEVMKTASPSKLREAALRVEIRYLSQSEEKND
jgi:hypothetical protein